MSVEMHQAGPVAAFFKGVTDTHLLVSVSAAVWKREALTPDALDPNWWAQRYWQPKGPRKQVTGYGHAIADSPTHAWTDGKVIIQQLTAAKAEKLLKQYREVQRTIASMGVALVDFAQHTGAESLTIGKHSTTIPAPSERHSDAPDTR